MFIMEYFLKIAAPRVAQENQIAAQKIPWLEHLHPRLRWSFGYDVSCAGNKYKHIVSAPKLSGYMSSV
jgi:hypothetical protein